MDKIIRVAVIGVGKLGSRHAEKYMKIPGVKLVGICDTDELKAREVAKACRTEHFRDYRDLIGKVDAANIVVPSPKHYEISKDFLEHGVHLLIEKPITLNVSHADELLRIAKEKRLVIEVGHIERFNSAIRSIQKILKTPRFIECHRLGPYDPRVADVGVTLDLMIHDIDIVLTFAKSPVKTLDAVGAKILSPTEDISNARIRFENNCVCNLTASRVTPDVVRKIRIFQEDAYISLDYVKQEAEIYTKDGFKIRHEKINIAKSDSLNEELRDFIECVRLGRSPVVTGDDARNALAVAMRISDEIQKTENSF